MYRNALHTKVFSQKKEENGHWETPFSLILCSINQDIYWHTHCLVLIRSCPVLFQGLPGFSKPSIHSRIYPSACRSTLWIISVLQVCRYGDFLKHERLPLCIQEQIQMKRHDMNKRLEEWFESDHLRALFEAKHLFLRSSIVEIRSQ